MCKFCHFSFKHITKKLNNRFLTVGCLRKSDRFVQTNFAANQAGSWNNVKSFLINCIKTPIYSQEEKMYYTLFAIFIFLLPLIFLIIFYLSMSYNVSQIRKNVGSITNARNLLMIIKFIIWFNFGPYTLIDFLLFISSYFSSCLLFFAMFTFLKMRIDYFWSFWLWTNMASALANHVVTNY